MIGGSTVVRTVTTSTTPSARTTPSLTSSTSPVMPMLPTSMSIVAVTIEIRTSQATSDESFGRRARSTSDQCEAHSAVTALTPHACHSAVRSSPSQIAATSRTNASPASALATAPAVASGPRASRRSASPAAPTAAKKLKPRLVPTIRQCVSPNEPLTSAAIAAAAATHRPAISARTMKPRSDTTAQGRRRRADQFRALRMCTVRL